MRAGGRRMRTGAVRYSGSCWRRNIRRLDVPEPWSEKIRHLLAGVVRLAG